MKLKPSPKSTIDTFQNTGTQKFPIDAHTTVSLENTIESQKSEKSEVLPTNQAPLRSRASTQPENSTPRENENVTKNNPSNVITNL
jgi:hypothetical protein